MASVYVVRHAIAEERSEERWPDDALRPLTKEGEERFRQAARGLATLVPSVDVVLSSPYVRAWRTAEILHEEAGWPPPTRAELLEAWRAPKDGLDLLKESSSHAAVALVGHEPYLSRFVSLLLTGDDAAVRLELKKGGVVHVDDGVLRWHAPPKALRGLAR
ncbi:MAG TPA: phosphoglycerate mutase family protein [Gaiellaceae bacterium]